MQLSFYDYCCGIGRKTIPIKDIDYSAEGIKNSLLSLNIKGAFAYLNSAAKEGGSMKLNENLFEEIKDEPFFNPVIGIVANPCESFEGPEYLENAIKKHNIKMSVMFPRSLGFSASLTSLGKYLDILNKHNIPLCVSYDEISEFDLSNILDTYNKLPVILGQTKYLQGMNVAEFLSKYNNLCIDTAFLPVDGIEWIVSQFGSERILFSSYAPETFPGAAVGRILLSDMNDKDKENIAYKNLERLTGGKLI